MPSIISLPIALGDPLPTQFTHDVRFSEDLVEYCLMNYSNPGDVVFDPFAGYGTTLFVAKRLQRIAFGVELDSVKVEFISARWQPPGRIWQGSILDLPIHEMPPINLIVTSPPYMNADETENPLDDYHTIQSYEGYLGQMQKIFKNLQPYLANDGICLIEVSNLYHGGHVTTLAWDLALKLRQIMKLRREIIIHWEGKEAKPDRGVYGYGYDHSYLLVFEKKQKINEI